MNKNNDMSINDFDERIEAYLRGTMTAEEETVFKLELSRNPELRRQAMTMTSLIKGFQKKESQKESEVISAATENASNIANVAPKRNTKIHTLLWWACSAAAVFAVFFGLHKDQRYKTLDATLSPYYIQYDMAEMTRGDMDSVTVAHLYALFTQIQEHRNVTNAIKELEPIYASLDSDYTYYLYANDIAWNLALAYVKNDQMDKAISILEKLKEDNPDTPISVKAEELLKKLSAL